MRTGQAAFRRQLRGSVGVNMRGKLLLDLLCVRERVGDRGNRLIRAGKRLLRRDIGVDGRRRFQQPAAVVRAVADDPRAEVRHAEGEILPQVQQGGFFLAVAQDARLVVVQAVVFLQITRVIGPKLAQRHIQEAPPRARARAHQHQILRTK